VRRLGAWIAGAVGGFAVYRLLRRRLAVAEPTEAPPPEPDVRVEELRTKLAETRAEEEPPAGPEPPPPESLDERRRRVHEEGRAAIDEMQSE